MQLEDTLDNDGDRVRAMHLQSLPQIFRPLDCLSEEMQQSCLTNVSKPRYFAWPRGSQAFRWRAPKDKVASIQYEQLFRGFLCARCLEFVRDDSRDSLEKLLLAETTELRHASLQIASVDGSLSPRAVAVWVQVPNSRDGQMPLGAHALDAAAHLANAIQEQVRCSWIADADARDFADRTFRESASAEAGNLRDDGKEANAVHLRVSLRWCERHLTGDNDNDDVRARTETMDICDRPQSALAAYRLVQTAMIRLVAAHNVQLPSSFYETSCASIPRDAFARHLTSAANAFEELKRGEECTRLSNAASQKQFELGPLEDSGVDVRVCARRPDYGKLGETFERASKRACRGNTLSTKSSNIHDASWLQRPDNFHGKILCFGPFANQVREFARREVSLPVPIGREEEWGLHLCALQPRRRQLGQMVSLYSAVGCPGVAIAPEHSCVWVNAHAIRPIDESLFQHFELIPCSHESTLPGMPCLMKSYCNLERRRRDLCSLLLEGSRLAKRAPPEQTDGMPVQEETGVTMRSPSPSTIEEDCNLTREQNAEDLFLLSALRLDLASERARVGDAIAAMQDCGAPTLARKMLFEAASIIGLDAPLHSVLEILRESLLQRRRTALSQVAEDSACARRQDAFSVLHSCRRATMRRDSEAHCDAAEYVHRIMAALGLQIDRTTTIRKKTDDDCGHGHLLSLDAMQLMARCTQCGDLQSSETFDCIDSHILDLWHVLDSETPREWYERAEHTILTALSMFVREANLSMGASPSMCGTSAFLICTSAAAPTAYRVERAIGSGCRASSFDEMCRQVTPRVLILKHIGEFEVQLSGLVQVAASI